MKVSRESWHYQLVNRHFFLPSKNLCVYFWQVVWSVIVRAATLALLALVLVVMTVPLWWWCADADLLGAALVGATLDILFLSRLWQKFRTSRPKRPKEPTLVGEWIRAKKERICPLIEFE